MQAKAQISPDIAYEQDYCLWLERTVNTLKCRDFNRLDLENLI